MKRPAITPRCTASGIPMAGVSLNISSNPVRLVKKSRARNPTSIPSARGGWDRIHLPPEIKQSPCADQQSQTANCSQHDGPAQYRVRCAQMQNVVANSGDGRRGKTEQETVKYATMEPSSDHAEPIVRIVAPVTAPIQIFELQDIPDRLRVRTKID